VFERKQSKFGCHRRRDQVSFFAQILMIFRFDSPFSSRNEKTVDFFESLLTSSFLVFDKAMVNENPPVFVMKIFEK